MVIRGARSDKRWARRESSVDSHPVTNGTLPTNTVKGEGAHLDGEHFEDVALVVVAEFVAHDGLHAVTVALVHQRVVDHNVPAVDVD